MTTYEQAKDTLLALAESTKGFDGNEATTRQRLIDAVLKDVLGWPPDEIAYEDYVENEYLDYVLGNPERRAVVEAKRTSRTFDVPAGVKSGVLDLATMRTYNPSNEAAVDQVLRYCQKSGIGVAILSNGHQYLGFLGSRSDGRKPSEGRAVFYDSLHDIYEDFARFWDYFSRDGLIRGDLTRALQFGTKVPPPPAPLSSRILGYPGYRVGSEMETDLRILGDLFIQDIVREETITDEFLKECYCSSGALSQYAVVSKEILKSRYTALSEQANIESASDRSGPNPHIKDDLLASAIVKRPIVLLGDVGVGKSIFLRHLFRIDASELLDKTVIFYVDFLKHSGLIDDVPNHIVSVITATLAESLGIEITDRDFVRSVYNREINIFKRGIFGSLEQDDPPEYRRRELEMLAEHVAEGFEHARRSLRFLQGSRGINFVIALDNVDQHLATFQEQIFVAGQSLAETWPLAVFMSLRPETFHESRRSGALAAYQPRVFTVSPPRSDHVIIKRLHFARKQLVESGRLPGFPAGLTLDSSSLLVYIDVLINALETNERLIQLIDNLSSGNTRRALDFISTFVGSGYVQTERILQVHERGGQYTVPIHEFIRAILYGDYRYYDPSKSAVPNLFSLHLSDRSEHFLSPILLASIQAFGERESGGFVELAFVYQNLQGLGYVGHQIETHLSKAEERQLIELTEQGESGRLVRITPAGGYLHKILIVDFAYVDAVVVDTPILEPAVRSLIRDVYDIQERVERAETFVHYLSDCWAFGDDDLPFSWPQMLGVWESNLQSVRRGVERAAARRGRGGQ